MTNARYRGVPFQLILILALPPWEGEYQSPVGDSGFNKKTV
jgi:hypothetical protein